MLLAADDSLTAPRFVLPVVPVNMAGPSSSSMNEIQEQLKELNRLTIGELRKGADRDKDLVAELQKQSEILGAQMQWQMSGGVQHHRSNAVLSSIPCLRLDMSHQHAHVMWSSSGPQGRLGPM